MSLFSPYQFHVAVPFSLTCDDICLNLMDKIREMGYSCTVGDLPRKERKNIALNISEWPCSKPPGCIKLQLEHLYQREHRPDDISLLQANAEEVWDFDRENISFLFSRGIKPVGFFNLGFHPRMSIARHLQQDITLDVAFLSFGGNARRTKYVKALRDRGVKIFYGSGIYNLEKPLVYARSKLAIHVHGSSEMSHLTPRILDLLNNGVCVVTEEFSNKEAYQDLLPGLSVVPAGDIPAFVEEVLRLLADPEARQKLALAGYQAIKKRKTTVPLPPAYLPRAERDSLASRSAPRESNSERAERDSLASRSAERDSNQRDGEEKVPDSDQVFHFWLSSRDDYASDLEYLAHCAGQELSRRYPRCEITQGDFFRPGAVNIGLVTGLAGGEELPRRRFPSGQESTDLLGEKPALLLSLREISNPPGFPTWLLGRDYYPGYSPRQPAPHLLPTAPADIVCLWEDSHFPALLQSEIKRFFPSRKAFFFRRGEVEGAALDGVLASAQAALSLQGEGESNELWICRCLDQGLEVVAAHAVPPWLSPYVWEAERPSVSQEKAQIKSVLSTLEYVFASLSGAHTAADVDVKRSFRGRKAPSWKTAPPVFPQLGQGPGSAPSPRLYPRMKDTPIFVVGIPRAGHRRRKISVNLKREGLLEQTHFITSPDARVEKDRRLIAERRGQHVHPNFPVSDGEIACFMGHLRALRAFLETGRSHALILEDDSIFCLDFCRLYDETVPPESFNVLLLCHYITNVEGIKIYAPDQRWQTIGPSTYHSGSYIICREYAAQCVERYDRPWHTIEHAQDRFTSEHITIYSGGLCIRRPLLLEEAENSYLRGNHELKYKKAYFDYWEKKGGIKFRRNFD